MNLRDIARLLGGELGRNGHISCPGPGHTGKDRSLSVWFDGDELRVYSFSGDSWEVCKDHVRERLGLPAWGPGSHQKTAPTFHVSKRPCDDHNEASRVALVRRLWHEAGDPREAPVMNYLAHRGLPPLSDEQLPIFRFHRNCIFGGESCPALLARFAPIESDLESEPTAIFRIRLDRFRGDGRKLALGPSRGQVIKLCRDISLGGVGIVEGVEKGLALIASGWRPVWATSGTSTMRTFPALTGVEALTVFSDADDAGRAAALACAARWHDAGREVRILQPPAPFGDWDDWFREGGHS